LFDGFDPLDVIAPFEVLAAGSDAVGGELEVELVSAEGPRPGVIAVPARVVDDGDLVSCGAVTSGLDLALHLLHRTYGPKVALAVEALFGYERRGTVWTDSGRILAVVYTFTESVGAQSGSATRKDETVPLRDLAVDSTTSTSTSWSTATA
jgi:hypothetical protein